MKPTPEISVIIPTFNEQEFIGECLESLSHQTDKNLELIIVDDGSTDQTFTLAQKRIKQMPFKARIFRQNHRGPGSARNFAAKIAKGKILVFVDSDMTFDKNFIEDLVKPIVEGKTIGTFSKNEMVKNPNNVWSRSWNINRNVPKKRMLPMNYPDTAPVFRSILKEKFVGVGGFETSGQYTDDWSLSRKLKTESTLAERAIYYHANPQTLKEIWIQVRWIGKSEFISGTLSRKIRSLLIYSLPFSLTIGLIKSIINLNYYFIVFKVVYDLAIFVSVLRSFGAEPKSK